jgi:hypothetical protein
MDLLPGFVWPVPRAFSSAVAACRFEQGDVLYDHPIAYAGAAKVGSAAAATGTGAAPADWASVISVLGHHVQVVDPPRSARQAPSDSAARRFLVNWEAPIRFEMCDYRSGRVETLKSTQGRLFSCLWKGDPALLAADDPGRESPPPPALARELQNVLEQALPAIRRAASGTGPLDGALIFAFVVDESSEPSLAKQRAILAALRHSHRTHEIDLSPRDAGLPGASGFHPALRVRGCLVEAASEQTVQSQLKSALYGSTRSAAAESAGVAAEAAPTSDRFRLERHGLLVEARASE